MILKPTLITGQTDAVKYLNQLDAAIEAGHLVLLPPDSMHTETTDYGISRRYLDRRSEEILRIKGRKGGPGDQYRLERAITRTKTTTTDGKSVVESKYSFRYFKPPLFGDVTLLLELTPQLPNQHTSTLIIDLSNCPFRVSETVNPQLVEAVIINAIARSFSFRRSLFSKATVKLSDIRIHHIDTGFGAVEYAIRRCIDQAVDDRTHEPTVSFANGLTIKYSEMRYSGALSVEIVGRLKKVT